MGYYEGLAVLAAIYCIAALGLYWPLFTGQVSVGHGGFMGVGAYLAGYATVELGFPLWIALICAFLVGGIIGFVVGIIALRFQGLYLAMATLAFGELVRVYFNNSETFGGAAGFGGMTGTTLPLVLGILAVLMVIAHFVQRSRIGSAMRAVGVDEQAAELVGLPTVGIKVAAFGIGAAVTGLAGGLYAHYAFYIEPSFFGFDMSILLLMMVILGGVRRWWGALIGALLFSLLPELLVMLKLQDWRMVVYGLIVAAVMIFRPEGVAGSDFSVIKRMFSVKRPGDGGSQSKQAERVGEARS